MPYRIKSPYTKERIGRRGACLLALGVIEIDLGWSIWASPIKVSQLLTVFRHLPNTLLGAPWVVAGSIALVYAFTRRGKNDGIGFIATYIMPFVWGLAYLLSWFPFGDLGPDQAMRAVGIYWGYALLIQVVAGWVEEPRLKGPPRELD